MEIEESRRLTAGEIFDAAAENARGELRRSTRALALSGLAGGLTMGLSGMAVAIVRSMLAGTTAPELVATLFYPIGFIAVIIGRAQLFTENTLYPVLLVLNEGSRHLRGTLRLWAVVLAANVAGVFLFALLAVWSGALRPEWVASLTQLGMESVGVHGWAVFWSGVVGGWLIALVAWMVSASQWTVGQIAVVWMLGFLVGLGQFAHCIATSGEILAACLAGQVPLLRYWAWFLPAVLGNVCGGVLIVSALNYGQVQADRKPAG